MKSLLLSFPSRVLIGIIGLTILLPAFALGLILGTLISTFRVGYQIAVSFFEEKLLLL